MTRKELLERMDAEEMFEWMAYELTQNPEYKEKLDREIELERQKSLSDEQRAEMIRNLFKGL